MRARTGFRASGGACLVRLSASLIALVAILAAPAGRAAAAAVTLEQALVPYNQNKMADALPLLEQVAARDTEDARAQVWLADTYRRLGRNREAVAAARLALSHDPCNSFAHVVLAAVYSPGAALGTPATVESTWTHLLAAVRCDSTDGNAWEYIAVESIRHSDAAQKKRSLRMLVESGHLTPAALSFGRWLLRTLPRDAILLTNGDLDTYPTMALQETEGLRQDVVVAERGMLGAPWFLRYIRDEAGVPLPFADAQLDTLSSGVDQGGGVPRVSDRIVRGWLERKSGGTFERPICVAVTVDESFRTGLPGHLQNAGPFWVWRGDTAGAAPDTAAMRASLEGARGDDFSGPWAGPKDHSPVHRLYSKQIARTVTGTALTYADCLIRAGRGTEAKPVIDWAERFESSTELGPVFTREIADLRATAGTRGK